MSQASSPRAREIEHARDLAVRVRTNRLFAILMAFQFAATVIGALIIAPNTWAGAESSIHVHVIAAITIGGALAALPITLTFIAPGWYGTQHVVGVAQVLFGSLFIHITGGRIEAHFHLFGSLAFIAFYRDWRTLVAPTLVIAIDHFARGIFWPESVFGVIAAAPWRALEHAGWVIFEDVFLGYSCVVSSRSARAIAEHEAELESKNAEIERQVDQRTEHLADALISLENEIEDRRRIESQLVQAQKLESIGQLAAGIAHEINTPAQYVGDNVRFVRDEFVGLLSIVDAYATQLDENGPAMSWDERRSAIEAKLGEVDYDFLRSEIPSALEQSLEGIERISHIVIAMKDFSHPGSSTKEAADLNKAIRSTVTVCSNRWKYAADLEFDLADAIPDTPCLLGEFNQVILNLVVNAADAIETKNQGQEKKGRIVVSTRLDGEFVEVRVADDGGGIPESIRERVFDPFFTTKEVGKGTGQGLAISRSVIVEKHGGTLDLLVEEGVGTTFVIRLPLAKQGERVAA
ncbi:MAG: hypothetical protein CMJ31_08380 [Phycisphaerae bacterium]|nr:hypothetical protein [Phycisphaerae bacterium]